VRSPEGLLCDVRCEVLRGEALDAAGSPTRLMHLRQVVKCAPDFSGAL